MTALFFRSTWTPSGSYISSNGDDCTGRLHYSVMLKQKGTVSFMYQHSDPDLVFHFYVS